MAAARLLLVLSGTKLIVRRYEKLRPDLKNLHNNKVIKKAKEKTERQEERGLELALASPLCLQHENTERIH